MIFAIYGSNRALRFTSFVSRRGESQEKKVLKPQQLCRRDIENCYSLQSRFAMREGNPAVITQQLVPFGTAQMLQEGLTNFFFVHVIYRSECSKGGGRFLSCKNHLIAGFLEGKFQRIST